MYYKVSFRIRTGQAWSSEHPPTSASRVNTSRDWFLCLHTNGFVDTTVASDALQLIFDMIDYVKVTVIPASYGFKFWRCEVLVGPSCRTHAGGLVAGLLILDLALAESSAQASRIGTVSDIHRESYLHYVFKRYMHPFRRAGNLIPCCVRRFLLTKQTSVQLCM